jgi:Fe-S cluster biosynthesis and repair protein YggX
VGQRTVQCVKLKRQLPGLDEPPIPGDLGQRVFENVSGEAWNMFMEHFKMIINEHQLNLMDEETDKIFNKQVEDFLFGEGAARPEGYIPPQST